MGRRFWFKGGVFIDGLRALMQWWQPTNHGISPLVPPGGFKPASVQQQGLWERAERLRGAADETARLTQTVYLSFLLLGTYIALIIGSTTDTQLLKVSPVTLPLLNVPLPIVEFYVIVPWLLLLVYFNVLLHFTFLADKLHQLKTVLDAFTDAAAREEQRLRVFPFPFSALLIGRPVRGSLRLLLGFMVVATVVLLPLILLLWTQVRFLPYHNTGITWTHRFAVLMDLILLWLFWPLIFPPVQRPASAAPSRGLWRVVSPTASATRFRWGTSLVCLTFFTSVVALVPLHRNLQLREQVLVAGEPAAEVIAALHSDDETKRANGLEKITGLILTNRDLRGADLRDTLFPKADLRGANLKGADLSGTRVFAGNLAPLEIAQDRRCVDEAQKSMTVCHTNLQGADLQHAQLAGAALRYAQLEGADLQHAHLAGSNLQHAQLAGANLQDAQLAGAALMYADLEGADLQYAYLEGAALRYADLAGANLMGAHLAGANLMGAHLEGADLQYAHLEGAALRYAYLEGANLQHAQLAGANLQHAHLAGAALWKADIGSAAFNDKVDLTWSDLRGLQQSPLEYKTYWELEKILTDAISDISVRKVSLKRLQDAIRRPTNLSDARADERFVLCDDVTMFRFCVTPEQIAGYADGRPKFLVKLGCQDAAIARGIFSSVGEDHRGRAFAQHVTPSLEKDCPGWAALSANEKDYLRKLAAGGNTVPK
jgi:uncharacterized protein YjbI with pentapeptide repeats